MVNFSLALNPTQQFAFESDKNTCGRFISHSLNMPQRNYWRCCVSIYCCWQGKDFLHCAPKHKSVRTFGSWARYVCIAEVLKDSTATSARSENRTWLVPRRRTSHMPRASTCWLSLLRTCGSRWSTAVRRQNTSGTRYQDGEKKEARQTWKMHEGTGGLRRTGREGDEESDTPSSRQKVRQEGRTGRQRKTAALSEGPISLLCSHACSLLAGHWAGTANTCLKHAGRETSGPIHAKLTKWTHRHVIVCRYALRWKQHARNLSATVVK